MYAILCYRYNQHGTETMAMKLLLLFLIILHSMQPYRMDRQSMRDDLKNQATATANGKREIYNIDSGIFCRTFLSFVFWYSIFFGAPKADTAITIDLYMFINIFEHISIYIHRMCLHI